MKIEKVKTLDARQVSFEKSPSDRLRIQYEAGKDESIIWYRASSFGFVLELEHVAGYCEEAYQKSIKEPSL